MDSYVRSSSHTWVLKVHKIRRPAGGQNDSAAKPHRWRGLSRRDTTKWVDVRLKYQGGSCGWVVVMARGRVVALPADTWLLDVLLDVNNAH